MFVAIIGTSDCGSTPVETDAGGQDATFEAATDACFFCVDAEYDAPPPNQLTCPDAGFYVTVDGDGDAAVLTSGYAGVPMAYYVDCCGYTAMVVTGSAMIDGGVSVQLQRAAVYASDGGVKLLANGSIANYFEADGALFSSYWNDASLTTVFTQLDPPGGVVAGSYAVTVASSKQPDASTLSLSGTFFTCRTQDAICGCPPPPP